MPLMLLSLMLLIALMLVLAVPLLLFWACSETAEESAPAEPRRFFISFHDGRIWKTFHGWFRNRPLQLTYRRDSRGRFRVVP